MHFILNLASKIQFHKNVITVKDDIHSMVQ